ncbi:hypothetical protein [Arenibaculum sp.]|jgi:hypothetical protein|uniref:hypothetical protein n=1 Tax=Arenibaculum sp. TaxID=2865862 RepID=UPI002E10508C|nr:hypothetical protein [Arenibaculum sp.]
MSVPPDHDADRRFVDANRDFIVQEMTEHASQEGVSPRAALLTLVGAAVGFAQKHHMEARLDALVAALHGDGPALPAERRN